MGVQGQLVGIARADRIAEDLKHAADRVAGDGQAALIAEGGKDLGGRFEVVQGGAELGRIGQSEAEGEARDCLMVAVAGGGESGEREGIFRDGGIASGGSAEAAAGFGGGKVGEGGGEIALGGGGRADGLDAQRKWADNRGGAEPDFEAVFAGRGGDVGDGFGAISAVVGIGDEDGLAGGITKGGGYIGAGLGDDGVEDIALG